MGGSSNWGAMGKTPITYSGFYNNCHANLIQYIFEWDPMKTTTKILPICRYLKAEDILVTILKANFVC